MRDQTLLLFIALLASVALMAQTSTSSASAQSSTPSTQSQPAKPESLDDDPGFKRLSPEWQAWVRLKMDELNKAIAEKDIAALDRLAKEPVGPPKPKPDSEISYRYVTTDQPKNAQPPNPQPPQSGCATAPVKKPRFHLPRKIQEALNKQAAKVAEKTGVELDPNAPQKAITDAQNKPCVVNPSPKAAKQ